MNGHKNAKYWDPWHQAWESNLKGHPLYALRDQLCQHLQQMGNPAEAVESETLGCGMCLLGGVAEIGLIDISYGPIGWVYSVLDGNEELWGEIEYGIQDERQLPSVGIKAEGVRSFPLVGQVTDVRWKAPGRDAGDREIAASLSGDRSIRDAIVASRILSEGITVTTCADHNRWWIHSLWEDPERPVSAAKWACYEMIAKHLLEFPLRAVSSSASTLP